MPVAELKWLLTFIRSIGLDDLGIPSLLSGLVRALSLRAIFGPGSGRSEPGPREAHLKK